MTIKEIHCTRWFLPNKFAAIVLYPFIFYNSKSEYYKNDLEALVFHEYVHVEQIRTLGWFRFYLDYLWQSLRFGYAGNKYEVEAFQKQHEFMQQRRR